MNYHDPIQPSELELERIKFKFEIKYDDGVLYERWTNIESGNGGIGSRGYKTLSLMLNGKKKQYLVHHIVWFLHYGAWPIKQLDHKDKNRLNNKINNLEESNSALQRTNALNKKSNLPMGVTKIAKRNSCYVANLNKNGIRFYLGCYDTPEKAFTAYKNKYKEVYGVEL